MPDSLALDHLHCEGVLLRPGQKADVDAHRLPQLGRSMLKGRLDPGSAMTWVNVVKGDVSDAVIGDYGS
jgi:hypothetical protein